LVGDPVIRHARATAPVRLDFAGGWTDVPPFSSREGGTVVGAAIELRAEAEVLPGGNCLRLVAEDLGETLELRGPDELATNRGLALHRAALRLARLSEPLTLRTHCEAPAGSGLGSSGAIDVALVAALAAATGGSLGTREIADAACRLEAEEAKIAGGRQDQFAAAYGGFTLLRFRNPEVEVVPLRPSAAFADELARRMVLCYAGASRFSGSTITRVMQAYEAGDRRVIGALQRMRCVAEEMVEALSCEDLVRVGALMADNWERQQALDAAMCTPAMGRLDAALRAAGALGGKAAGSGAGGCMFFIAGDDVAAARRAAIETGARLLPVAWAWEGVRAW
jgi:D-glycero-alpha-D-manno-heptose-7-phosphate kinase